LLHHAIEHELDVVEAFPDLGPNFGAGHRIAEQEHADLVLGRLRQRKLHGSGSKTVQVGSAIDRFLFG
jgi:hypothetical protein